MACAHPVGLQAVGSRTHDRLPTLRDYRGGINVHQVLYWYQGITFKGRDRDAPLKIKKES